ncbi:gluconate:H+ symporter [Ferruginibacter paludis]|jgi:Gnt-I system high-affinity gluconate transporter|uniref:gluconate:H+ symporter n=1 Tax=Ferruginibacter paludis TaxID=1310417 RepID=UPI0025B51BDA|nr:gluconate:H+ symporter [Ferruginibacter paludis]MDN3655163.1 gluconate:H+ symporter [Ferruginibacter paludis]
MQLLVIFSAICFQIFLTYKKVSPFLSLLIVAILSGLLLGMEPMQVIKSLEKGVGNTLGGLALIICLGAILGKILEAGGAVEKIATTLINSFGQHNIQWAILLTGFLIGIPLYYNAGFVILVPLVFSVAQKAKLSLLYVAIPMAASLSTTHCFLPPHPSPVFLVNAFKADMGKTLIYGFIITIPIVIIAGPLLGRLLKGIEVTINSLFLSGDRAQRKLPAAFPSFIIGLLPVILITLAVIANQFLPDQLPKKILVFMGDPTIALLLSVLLAIWQFGLRGGNTMQTTMQWLSEAISGIALIVLIITAGGVFKQVLQDSGTDQYIASFSSKWLMPPLIFGWAVTAFLRVVIGSATVAGITAAGVVTPLVASGVVSPELMVLAVGAGSVFGSHINDSGFWMFKEFFGLSLKQTFLSWTVMETGISILGLIGVLILNLFI